jgi:hypothetical protein
MESEKKEEQHDNICLVCKKNPICYRVMPCRHAYLCKKCSMKMASGGKCKICHEFFVECQRILTGDEI